MFRIPEPVKRRERRFSSAGESEGRREIDRHYQSRERGKTEKGRGVSRQPVSGNTAQAKDVLVYLTSQAAMWFGPDKSEGGTGSKPLLIVGLSRLKAMTREKF